MDDRRLINDCFALPPNVEWTPVDDALAALRASVKPIAGLETVSLANARGRILGNDALAIVSHPAAANAAVDGYAFAHTEYLSGPLTIADGRAAAGAPYAHKLARGGAVRILTGGLLPEGADTVLMDEDARLEGNQLHCPVGLKRGANRRKAGENVAANGVALTAGTRLSPQALAHAAAAGLSTVQVQRRLRVGVLSTGEEVHSPGANLPPGGLHDANGPMLTAMAEAWGFDVVPLGIAGDDETNVRSALDQGAASADVILASGGASAGDEDHLARMLGAEGTRAIWRIAMKPGRPLALGRWNGVPVFGLPGNPVAAFVCTLIFARPALLAMSGAGWLEPVAEMRSAGFAKRRKAGRREYLRARLMPDGSVETFANEGSGLIRGLVWADGLVDLPDGGPDVAMGDRVAYLPFHGFGI